MLMKMSEKKIIFNPETAGEIHRKESALVKIWSCNDSEDHPGKSLRTFPTRVEAGNSFRIIFSAGVPRW